MFIIGNKFGNILTMQGRFEASRTIGAGGYQPKQWKTRKGAEKYAAENWSHARPGYILIVELDERGARAS
jgi:hypothetical protein